MELRKNDEEVVLVRKDEFFFNMVIVSFQQEFLSTVAPSAVSSGRAEANLMEEVPSCCDQQQEQALG